MTERGAHIVYIHSWLKPSQWLWCAAQRLLALAAGHRRKEMIILPRGCPLLIKYHRSHKEIISLASVGTLGFILESYKISCTFLFIQSLWKGEFAPNILICWTKKYIPDRFNLVQVVLILHNLSFFFLDHHVLTVHPANATFTEEQCLLSLLSLFKPCAKAWLRAQMSKI